MIQLKENLYTQDVVVFLPKHIVVIYPFKIKPGDTVFLMPLQDEIKSNREKKGKKEKKIEKIYWTE